MRIDHATTDPAADPRPDPQGSDARGVADEVPDDEEVARIPHLLDHLDLVLETTLIFLSRVTQLARTRAARESRSRCANPSRATCSKYWSIVSPSGTPKIGR
jgi:hypothetical protein